MADEVKRFHYPPVAEYTGFVQYAIDRNGVATLTTGERAYGEVHRGGVVEMKRGLAELLVVRGGDFTHVAADTPLGQPEEYKPVKSAKKLPETRTEEGEG